MSKPRFYRKFPFGGIEFYSWHSWFIWISLGTFEIQFNKWSKKNSK